MCKRSRSDSGAVECPLGLVRVVHVGRTISGGPPMTEANVKIAVNHLRRISAARERAARAERAVRQSRTSGRERAPRER